MRGYFEWTGEKGDKTPHFLHSDGLLSAAGLTREARDASGEVHDRMPAFLTPDTWDAWLTPEKPSIRLRAGDGRKHPVHSTSTIPSLSPAEQAQVDARRERERDRLTKERQTREARERGARREASLDARHADPGCPDQLSAHRTHDERRSVGGGEQDRFVEHPQLRVRARADEPARSRADRGGVGGRRRRVDRGRGLRDVRSGTKVMGSPQKMRMRKRSAAIFSASSVTRIGSGDSVRMSLVAG